MSITPRSSRLKHIASGLAAGLKGSPSRPSIFSSAIALALTPVSLLALSAQASPAQAASPDYYACAADIKASGVAEAEAIAACAAARYPENLGSCVVDVNELTGLTANSALLVCERSRRPLEVANCTIDIHAALFDSPSTEALQNCGRSLLPERYSSCVIDISEATEIAANEALTQCTRAGYRPWTIQPRS
jgi:hypothetical protein